MARHKKKSLPCLDRLSYLLSDLSIFSRPRKFHVTPVFKGKKMSAPSAKRSSGRTKKTTSHPKNNLARYGDPSASWLLLLPVDRPRLFRSTERVHRVMGNLAYDWRRLN